MKTITNHCFIKEIGDKFIECYFFKLDEFRMIKKSPFFEGMQVFVGANILFTTVVGHGSLTATCTKSSAPMLRQLWNYYIRGKF